MIRDLDLESLPQELTDLLGADRQIEPLTSRWRDFDLSTAYAVAELVRARRERSGDWVVGRKIGFTNFRMWDTYGIREPIWGYVYGATCHSIADVRSSLSLGTLREPKIEPEIVFGLGASPSSGMSDGEILDCIDWVALGFEIVWSPFPGWRFKAADAIAGFGVHGALVIGEKVAAKSISDITKRLSTFAVTLSLNGAVEATGGGSEVLGSPLSALRHLNELLANPAFGPPLRAGEIISTGTLTLAAHAAPGQRWAAAVEGIDLPEIALSLV